MAATVTPPESDQDPRARRADETRRLLVRHHRDGDESARGELIERFLPMARSLARRYRHSGEPLDDLVQVASLGLVKAVDRFELDRDVAFSSYAVPTILGELKRYFRDTTWAVHVPRGLQERSARLDQAVAESSRRTGRPASPDELARTLGVSVEDVLETLLAASGHDTVSLDAPRRREDSDAGLVREAFGAEDHRFALVEDGSVIAGTLAALTTRDRAVLALRFGEDLTQSEIAARIGVSQMQVSRLLRRSLERLRTAAVAAG